MGVLTPEELARYLKDKRDILVMAGSLCERIDFDGKKLVDYVAAIAHKLKAPVAATGNTMAGLKEKGLQAKKMWVAEVMDYMRHPWKEPLISKRPRLLVFVGYHRDLLEMLVSMLKDVDTLALGPGHVASATRSVPDLSIESWKDFLEDLAEKL